MSICNEPLGLPKGSVRAVIAIVIIVSSIYALLKGILNAETFVMVTSIITAFYFGNKKTKE